jgi:hypothetical protein
MSLQVAVVGSPKQWEVKCIGGTCWQDLLSQRQDVSTLMTSGLAACADSVEA